MDHAARDALLAAPDAWEKYRTALPEGERPDLTDMDLAMADLSGKTLTRANLAHAKLERADLTSADLTRANLNYADITGATLVYAQLTSAILAYAHLTSANLTRANLAGTDLAYAYLNYADLTRANLTGADLSDANLTGANLTGADLSGADLTGANLRNTNLTGANLRNANLKDVKINPDTINSAGNTLLSVLKLSVRAESVSLDEDVVRIQADLPGDIDPLTLAEYATSIAVLARLASRVGGRLQRDWLGQDSAEPSGNVLIATADEPSFVTVRGTHYGSPWWVDLVENSPPVIQGIRDVAGPGAAAFLLGKHGRRLLSFLLTLARREERDLWLQTRTAQRRFELAQVQAEERRIRPEIDTVELRIEPASEAEFRRRVAEAVDDPESQDAIQDAIPELMPLIGNGITVTTVLEDETIPMTDESA